MLNFIVGFWFGRIRIRIWVAKKWTFFIVVIVFFTWLFVPRTILYITWFSSLISWWSSDDQLGIKIFDNSPSDSDSSSSSSRSSSSESSSDLLASSSEETTAPIIFFSNSIPLYFNRFGRKKTDLYFYSSVFFQSFLFLSLAFGIFFLSLRFYRCHISFISYMDTILHHPTTTPTSQLLTIWTCSKRAANILHHTGYRAKLRYNSLLTIFRILEDFFRTFSLILSDHRALDGHFGPVKGRKWPFLWYVNAIRPWPWPVLRSEETVDTGPKGGFENAASNQDGRTARSTGLHHTGGGRTINRTITISSTNRTVPKTPPPKNHIQTKCWLMEELNFFSE